MDIASSSINRHRPNYDKYMRQILRVDEDSDSYLLFAFYKTVLDLPEVKRHIEHTKDAPKYEYPAICDEPLEVNYNNLRKAASAIETAHADLLDDPEMLDMLFRRKISTETIKRYKFCKTVSLFDQIGFNCAYNLSLMTHKQFWSIIGASPLKGISIPYTYNYYFSGFATRVLDEEQSKFIKYAFTTPGRMCFGIDFSPALDEIFVVEGVFDAIALHEIGLNAMALGDSQPNPFQLAAINNFKKINLMFDNDYAGCLGALKASTFLSKLEKDHNIYLLDSKDPAEHLLKHGKHIVDDYIVSYDKLRGTIDELFDPERYNVSWWDHKQARNTLVDFD